MNAFPSFRFLDVCAGIGAGHAAAASLDGECVGYSEINAKAKRTYRLLHELDTLWEPMLDLGDLTQRDPTDIPDFDLLMGGFPCQTFSIVGRRQGFEDPRGKIIFAIADILAAKKPAYCLLENVKGLVSHDGGKTIRAIERLLRSVGYRVSWSVVSSETYGVPQKRERVYFVGTREDLVDPSFRFQFPGPKAKLQPLRAFLDCEDPRYLVGEAGIAYLNKYLNNKYNNGRMTVGDLLALPDFTVIDTRQSDLRLFEKACPTLRSGRQGILYVRRGQLRKLSGLEALALQGFDKRYQKRIRGVSDSDLHYQAGNAFTVDVVKCLLEAVFEQVASTSLQAVQPLAV